MMNTLMITYMMNKKQKKYFTSIDEHINDDINQSIK
jgi:hypothetical protein